MQNAFIESFNGRPRDELLNETLFTSLAQTRIALGCWRADYNDDRLGRNYSDVRDTIQEFMRRGVVVRTVINGLTFDGATKDPMQQAVRDALIGFLAATAQANAEAIKEAQRGGIALAKAKEGETKYRGRKPSYTRSQFTTVQDMIAQSAGIGQIAKATGLSRQAIYRIKDDPAAAEAALASWSARPAASAA
jgi:putative DNA-invertase from lambdoid prophage Rac